jgi:hypothetical protein
MTLYFAIVLEPFFTGFRVVCYFFGVSSGEMDLMLGFQSGTYRREKRSVSSEIYWLDGRLFLSRINLCFNLSLSFVPSLMKDDLH